MAKITVQLAPLKNPQWSATPLKPGAEVTLSVEAPKIKAGQHIEFRILYGTDLVDVVNGADAQQTAKWTVPNLPHSPKLKFDALLHEKPSATAGIHGVLGKTSAPLADVKGFAVTITNVDAAFVPHAEKIQVAYTVADPTGVAKNGRIEIWGERYSTDKPLYTENFAPAHGAHNWTTWDGKANAGPLSGKYITPEYSPYRVRFIVGINQGSVDDAFAAGLKKVAVSERPFEVEFQSVHIRLQAGITESAPAGSAYLLAQALAVEPQPLHANGTFAAMGRLPLEQETAPGPARPGIGRIRIPCERHDLVAENPAQGGLAIGAAYTTGVLPKNTIDAGLYSRPELPIEFECRLKSRVANTNLAPTFGTWDKEAVGPMKIEPFAEDVFLTAIYGGAGVNQAYWRKSATKVKDGTHTVPVNTGGNPVFNYWQARFVVAADGDQTFNLDTFDTSVGGAGDTTYRYVVGSGELKVYVNRTLLTLGANEAAINKGDADYIEVDVHTIKIRPRFTKANDVIWIVRSAAAAGAVAVANWNAYPPGVNCHAFYGGIRGASPNNLFLKNYSGAPAAGRPPIIGGATGAYTYSQHRFIDLAPDPVPAAQQERVESSAVLTGAQQGLAGIIFTPSFISGDTYTLHGRLNRVPYERNLGWEDEKPYIDGKAGQLSVWRVMTVSNSVRLPSPTTNGLAAGIGCPVEAAIGGRAHPGDGVNMSISNTNNMMANAFNEWTMPPPNAGIAPAADTHKDVNLTTYRNTNNAHAGTGAGLVNMTSNAIVKNVFSPFDHYRVQLPSNFPANRVNLAANTIATVAPGATSVVAMGAVSAAIGGLAAAAADPPLNVGVAAIPLAAFNGQAYKTWVDGITSAHRDAMMNALTPSLAPQPRTMQVIRWPVLEDTPIWVGGVGATRNGLTLGYDRGDGQSIFDTSNLSASLFPHEMGHSLHLVHFVAGNFGWKHHHVLQADCMMSYDWPTGIIVSPAVPAGPTGVGATNDTGWPTPVPAPLPANTQILAGTAALTPSIQLDAIPPTNALGAPNPGFRPGLSAPPPGNPCAKCVLKMRGWLETVLPVAWRHPDLF